jgi:flagellar hook-length control protein FliK
MVDKILSQASLLVKEGGGSIRLQVENPDIGQIDLALSVSEDAVRLRVLSGSDQVKELLISDMPRLRDLLEGQNLKLENIEFARHNHGHEAFSDSRQYQDRPQYQNIFENSFQPTNLNKSQSPWHKSGQIKYPSTHMGSIQVLA